MRTQSHVLPSGSLSESAMRENLSEAYLAMVASAAGLTLGSWGNDYDGVDVTLKSKVDYTPGSLHPKIDIQLKCTGQERAVREETIAWALEPATVKYLRAKNRSNPGLFCVLVAPDEPGWWLSHNVDGLLAHSHMYWTWGCDLPTEKPAQKHQTVHLPKRNLINPQSLLDLMKEASAWLPTS